jgi:hypothetical protein
MLKPIIIAAALAVFALPASAQQKLPPDIAANYLGAAKALAFYGQCGFIINEEIIKHYAAISGIDTDDALFVSEVNRHAQNLLASLRADPASTCAQLKNVLPSGLVVAR